MTGTDGTSTHVTGADGNAVAVRRAVAGDAAGYIRLIRGVLNEQPRADAPYSTAEFTPSGEAIRERIRETAPNSLFLIAETGTPEAGFTLVGALTCAGGTRAADRHSTELGVYVAAAWRGQGVGGRLLAAAVNWAETSGAVGRLWLEVMASNTRAIALYERHGFMHEGRQRAAIVHDGRAVDMLIMARLFPGHLPGYA